MKAHFILCVIAVLVLSACAPVEERINPRINNKIAAQANTHLGVAYLREGNYKMARLKIEKALTLQPDRPDTQEAAAILYEKVGESERAERHYRKMLDLNPDYARGHNNYGQFLCGRARYREAEREFLLAANNPFYDVPGLALTNAGLCARRLPDMVKAEEYFRRALDKDPGFAPALLQMGLISYEKGNYMSTRGYIQRLHEVRTEYALHDHQAWGNYAILLRSNFPDSNEASSLQEWENERRKRK